MFNISCSFIFFPSLHETRISLYMFFKLGHGFLSWRIKQNQYETLDCHCYRVFVFSMSLLLKIYELLKNESYWHAGSVTFPIMDSNFFPFSLSLYFLFQFHHPTILLRFKFSIIKRRRLQLPFIFVWFFFFFLFLFFDYMIPTWRQFFLIIIIVFHI